MEYYGKAEEAKIQTQIANIKEQIQTEILGIQAEKQGNISETNLREILERHGTLSDEEKIMDKTLTTKEGNYQIEVSDLFGGTVIEDKPKIANVPDIDGFNKEKSFFVEWDLTSNPYQIKEETSLNGTAPVHWYDYTEGVNQWANLKTVGGGNDCYWVWIPRYAYKITYTDANSRASGTIDVVFLKEKTNEDFEGNDVSLNSYVNSKGDTGAYIVHPAFTNSGNGGFGELTGIWVAKFEASSSKVSESTVTTDLTTTGGGDTTNLQVRVKSNVTSWRGITVGNILTVCKNLTTSGNSMEGATNMDPHMIKSTEWGAVAYLSRSKYGKNSAVWNNSYQNNIGNMSPITGICGNSQDMSQTDFTNTYQYNETGGENASTSGNVYGVYDMAGGAWEYVAGVLSSMKSNGSYYNFTNMDTKYYDSYDNYSDTKYGDAIYETSTKSTQTGSWDNDYSNFSTSSYPVLRQGGRSGDGINAGVFAFYSYTGQAHTCISFRPCLVRK